MAALILFVGSLRDERFMTSESNEAVPTSLLVRNPIPGTSTTNTTWCHQGTRRASKDVTQNALLVSKETSMSTKDNDALAHVLFGVITSNVCLQTKPKVALS